MATGICESVLFELNSCRSNPSKYSLKLSNILKFYKGKIYAKPGYPAYETSEGPENVQACIKYLKSVRPAPPLEYSAALSKAAQFHVDDLGPKGLNGHDSSDGADAAVRVEKFGQWAGQLGENIDYGNCEGEDIVVSLLIDDGVVTRGQRLNIMKREHVYVGIGFGYHSEYEYMCVIIFAEVVIETPFSSVALLAEKENSKETSQDQPVAEFDASLYSNKDVSVEDVRGIKKLFDSIDVEGCGSIEVSDIQVVLQAVSKSSEIIKVLAEINKYDKDKIGFGELVERFSQAKSNKKKKSVTVQEEKNIVYEVDESQKEKTEKNHSNLTEDDIEQMKEVFDAYDSDSAGYINLEDLVSQIKDGEYEEGLVKVIDVLISLNSRGKRKVTFDQLLKMLDSKISEKLNPKPEKKVTYSNNEIKTTTYTCGGKTYTKTTKKTVTKYSDFDPSEYVRPGLAEEEIMEIKDAFDLFDPEKSGTIETGDLRNAMESQGFQEKSPVIFKMVCELDVEGKKRVDFNEFLDMMTEQDETESTKDEIRKVFNLFDVDQTGFIELGNLKKIARELGESLKEEEIVELITKSDADGDGRVSFQEFYDIMSTTTY